MKMSNKDNVQSFISDCIEEYYSFIVDNFKTINESSLEEFVKSEEYSNYINSDKCKKYYCSDIYKEFKRYCEINKLKECSQKTFINLMEVEISTIKKKNRKAFINIKFTKPIEYHKLPEYYGEIELAKIETGNEFFFLLDTLFEDEEKYLPPDTGFRWNKRIIADSFKDGCLYGLRVNETKEMYEKNAWKDEIFGKGTFYLLPCFCIMTRDICEIIWIKSNIRKQGLGKKFIELLNIKKAYRPVKGSEYFWKKK
jgi:hypothetical protein